MFRVCWVPLVGVLVVWCPVSRFDDRISQLRMCALQRSRVLFSSLGQRFITQHRSGFREKDCSVLKNVFVRFSRALCRTQELSLESTALPGL